MATDDAIVGSVAHFATSQFAWTVAGMLGGAEQTVYSPRFTYCGYTFSFKLSTRLCKGHISIYLKADKARCGWPELSFSISLTCTNRDMPQLPIVKDTSHAYNDHEEDWGFKLFCTNNGKTEDTYMITVHITAFKPAEGVVRGLDDNLLLPVSGQPSALAEFYGNANLSDCTVCTDDGRSFPAHKLALCSASPVLKAMFTTSSSMQDASSNTITMRDADPVVVELLLQHAYGIPQLRVPVAAVVAFYKLADQYQITAAKDSLMQVVQQTVLTEEALCRLLPQAISLGSVSAPLTKYLSSEAVSCYEEILQQQDYLINWRQADVQELIQAVLASPQPCCPSKAYKCILLGAAWAFGVDSGPSGSLAVGAGPAEISPPVVQGHPQQATENASIRLQQWHEIQSCMRLEDLTLEEAKLLQADPTKPFERLPGLAAAVLAVVLRKA